jgi:hypothetical protein
MASYEKFKEKVGRAFSKPKEMYLKVYERNPKAAIIVTRASLPVAGFILGELFPISYTSGEEGHFEDIYNYTKVGERTRQVCDLQFNPALGFPTCTDYDTVTEPVYNVTKVGEKWVESTLEDRKFGLGTIIGPIAGLVGLVSGMYSWDARKEKQSDR